MSEINFREVSHVSALHEPQDVEIRGEWKRLIREARNSHWMMVYGDYLREVGYAAHKIGLQWDNVSDGET